MAKGRFSRLLDRFRRTPAAAPATPAHDDVLRIAYDPRPDGEPQPGEVVWTWVPFEDDPSQGKDRPVLVIGYLGPSLAALPLTSKDHDERRDVVELGSGPWDRQGRVSYVKLDQVLRVPPDKVRREGAALDRPRFDHIVAELQAYHAR